MDERERLAAAGEALYGPVWQRLLARDLPADDRLVRRLAAGSREVPVAVWDGVLRLLRQRQRELEAAMAAVEAAVAAVEGRGGDAGP